MKTMKSIIISKTMAKKIGAFCDVNTESRIAVEDDGTILIGCAAGEDGINTYVPLESAEFTDKQRMICRAYVNAMRATEGRTFWECDYYQIEEYAGVKTVKVDGYFYDTGDGKEKSSRCVEYSNVMYPIDEFVKMVNENDDFRDEITELASENKQWIDDLTEEEAIESMQNFYDEPATPLSYEKITIDTPCGLYIDGEGVKIKEEV